MTVLTKIREFIRNFDSNELYRVLAIIGGVLIFLVGLLLFLFYSSVQQLQKKLVHLNQQREQARLILDRNAAVLQQQAKVDEILAKDKTFKLKQYFTTVVQNLGLMQYSTREAEVTSEDLAEGYIEFKLTASFNGINMKQLTDLLYAIEQNERVYTKDIKITKSQRMSAIDVSLVIATFEAAAVAP